MASIYDLKPKFQNLLRPLVGLLARIGVSANQVTLLAMLLSIAAGAALFIWPQQYPLFLLIPILLFVRMALNAIDGMLAREHNMKSPFGAILNELGDVVSDAALYLPFALLTAVNPLWVVFAVLLAVISEMTGVIAVQIGAQRRYDGPMGKSDRAFVFGLIALLLGLQINLDEWLNTVFILMNMLLLVTIFNRIRSALNEVKHGS
ncbi:MAG: CDP-alcohol phosphatidyltransferase family protein [Gammaproteobacteria bacterium]|nr:CDP-alcohol phosphatidyltransferase family protein [Gammaproteobacteria bacterium]MDH5730565.1 CDP-alcohol phosphatidyltransferase family protein [Gammaproteobacteria bacterium]